MDFLTELPFRSDCSSVMHIDINSCFATIEQQANPLLRGKPIAVAAYSSPGGCILAASIEAKQYGIKTGMRVGDGRRIYPKLIVLTPDSDKYRFVHKQFDCLLKKYTNNSTAKSIDEFVLHFPIEQVNSLFEIARQIKTDIRKDIGEWMSVSVGIGPNRFLAKTASNLKKPDGLEEINITNFESVYKKLSLIDLYGINVGIQARLHRVGINSVWQLYNAPMWQTKITLGKAASFYWYCRLRGWEIDQIDFARRSFGNSYSLPHSDGSLSELIPLIQTLVEKTGIRMRKHSYFCRGVHISLWFKDRTSWGMGRSYQKVFFNNETISRELTKLLRLCPDLKPVHTIAISCFDLVSLNDYQLDLFENIPKTISLTQAIDKLSTRFGNSTVVPARILQSKYEVRDRIGFGRVKEL